jgi:signal transduction histidine kinase
MWRFALFGLVALLFLAALVSVTVMGALAALGAVRVEPPARLLALVLLVVLVVVGARWFRRLGAPVGALVAAARRIEAGDYSARVPEYGLRELRSVARAFNSMSARLQADETRRRDFLADVAHQMRTPLAVIQGEAEAIADGVHPGDAAHLMPILDATRLLERLVEDLRQLAQVEGGGLQLVREPVDVARLIEETVSAFRSQAEAAGIRLSGTPAAGLGEVEGDAARLQGVVANLVSNALRHTPQGGSVTVSGRRAGEQLTIEVRDDGEGIAPDLLPRVFDRFVRGPGSDGTGLGLAIARDVVIAHGGTIDVRSDQGTGRSGTTFPVTLPAGAG